MRQSAAWRLSEEAQLIHFSYWMMCSLFIRSCVLCGVFIVARQADGWLCAEDFAKKTVGALSWGRKSIDLSVVNTFVKRIQERYHYSLVVLKELVKTDFKLRYQGSFLGVAWSVLRPLMLFCVMYVVFAKFLRMSDGTPTYPVVLLLGISTWQFFGEATATGLRAVVDRGDLLRKIHFPNYIVVVSATIGALISLGINLLVVVIFAIFSKIQFTWRVLLLPLNFIELYVLALGAALLMATMYVYFRDIAHLWEVLQQVLFYSIPVIYPLSMVMDNDSLGKWGLIIAKIQLLNPIAQTIQDIRHNLVSPSTVPTTWSIESNIWISLIPVILTFIILAVGAVYFSRNSKRFAEIM